jgi:hypothetical protein
VEDLVLKRQVLMTLLVKLLLLVPLRAAVYVQME